jgi:hypothetical protein
MSLALPLSAMMRSTVGDAPASRNSRTTRSDAGPTPGILRISLSVRSERNLDGAVSIAMRSCSPRISARDDTPRRDRAEARRCRGWDRPAGAMRGRQQRECRSEKYGSGFQVPSSSSGSAFGRHRTWNPNRNWNRNPERFALFRTGISDRTEAVSPCSMWRSRAHQPSYRSPSSAG